MSEYIGIPEEKIKKILHSEYMKESVKDILIDIKEGKTLFSNPPMKLGFGGECYYKSKRKMLEDLIYQFIMEADDEIFKIFTDDLVEMIKEEAQWNIGNSRELIESLHGTEVRITVDLKSWLNDIRIYMERYIKKLTDEEIEKLVDEYE